MTRGTHTSCPSSTSERPDMATGGAMRRRPRSLVAHRRGTAASSPSGELAPRPSQELDPTGRARRPMGSSAPPAARQPGGARSDLPRRRPRVPTARGSSGLATGELRLRVGGGGGQRRAAAPEGRRDRGTRTTGLNAQRLGSEEERSGRRLKINMTCGSHTKKG
jgi:hypothetical protein